jgi:hypothetical protein
MLFSDKLLSLIVFEFCSKPKIVLNQLKTHAFLAIAVFTLAIQGIFFRGYSKALKRSCRRAASLNKRSLTTAQASRRFARLASS